jgi:2-phospho-L-lactate guanylyltransferase
MEAGILAVKRLDQAKSRLGPSFDSEERKQIARALMEDAFELCAAASSLTWWVVSDDASVLSEAEGEGFRTVRDEGVGLNEALTTALREVSAAGVESVTILPADVPLGRTEDIQEILDTGATSELVIVPAGDGGTNALYMRPPGLVIPLFGEKSLQAHLDAAEKAKLRCSVLPLPSLSLDIDTPEDVERLLEGGPSPSRAVALLSRLRPEAPAET